MTTDDLPPPQRVALAYTPVRHRPALAALLAFDALLARLVAGASEPLLGQVRLAWWRGELDKERGARTAGNPDLAGLGAHWVGEEHTLVELIDGWERLLGDAPLPADAIAGFAAGRGAAFAGFARQAGAKRAAASADLAGRRWALADFSCRVSDRRERETARDLFERAEKPARLPRALRGLAVLDGLAARAFARGEPLMAGRAGALAAMRLGMLGR